MKKTIPLPVAHQLQGPMPRAKYHHIPADEKLRIVQETYAQGASVAEVARRNGVNANQVFNWRREQRAGKIWRGSAALPRSGFIPVMVEGNGESPRWQIEVELANGIRLRLGKGEEDMQRVLLLARGLS